MKKLVVLFVLSIPALGLCATLSEQINRAAANAYAQSTVQVQVKLAKPVYMSDMMFRRPRGKDVLIRTDYKENTCTGRLSAQRTHVIVPVACVQDRKYKVEQIRLTFADGRKIKKSVQALHLHEKSAHIAL